MSEESKHIVEANKIYLDEQTWNDLRNGKSLFVLNTVISGIRGEIKKDKSFVIESDIGVVRHIHRLSDFEEYVKQIDQDRKTLGLDSND